MKKSLIALVEGVGQALWLVFALLLILLYPKWWDRQIQKSREARVMLGEEETDVF